MKVKMTAIFLIIAGVAAASAVAGESDETIVKAELPGVVNYTKMSGSEGYAGATAGFGGATEVSALQPLKDEGYAAVINLRQADEKGVDLDASRMAAEAAGIKYIHMPFDSGNPDPAVIDAFMEAVGDPANQPVYIHCGSATRVGALWMIGRVQQDGWSLEAAGEEVKQIAGKPDSAIGFATRYVTTNEKQ